jgi:hypothetical protein
VLFFVYVALALGTGAFTPAQTLITGVLLQHTYRRVPRLLSAVAPNEVLEVYPLLLGGIVAGQLCPYLVEVRPTHALTVWCFGVACNGLGLFNALLVSRYYHS